MWNFFYILVGIILPIYIFFEYTNHKTYLNRLENINSKTFLREPDEKFIKMWEKYVKDDPHKLTVLFETYSRDNIDFTKLKRNDIREVLKSLLGIDKVSEEFLSEYIEQLKSMGCRIINNKDVPRLDLKHYGKKTHTIYKPLFFSLFAKYMNYKNQSLMKEFGYKHETTPEGIVIYYLDRKSDRTLVFHPGIGIGPIYYQKIAFANIQHNIVFIDSPNINVLRHYYHHSETIIDTISKRTIDFIKKHNMQNIILSGHSFGSFIVSNMLYHKLYSGEKKYDFPILRIILNEPLCFYSELPRTQLYPYRLIDRTDYRFFNFLTNKLIHGDIGLQYMYRRQMKSNIIGFYFEEDEITSKTTVNISQKDGYARYPHLLSFLHKYYPLIEVNTFPTIHSGFINDNNFTEFFIDQIIAS